MAVIDYGGVLLKNGKFINQRIRFMKTTDTGYKIPENVNCFIAAGDEKFCLIAYKCHVYVILNGEIVGAVWLDDIYSKSCENVIFTKMPYEKRFNIFGSGIDVIFECIDHEQYKDECGYRYYSNKYHVNFEYCGNVYDMYFGYGVDSDPDTYERIRNTSYYYTEMDRKVFDKIFGF